MKTATITFQNTNNFGAALQCFALQQSIKSLGAENEVLNYTSPYLNHPHKLSVLKDKGFVRYLLGVFYSLLRSPRNKKFREFRKNLRMSKPLHENSIKTIEKDYDLFITGSDQVWNGSLVGYDDSYFLGFVKDQNKKASYAASFGFLKIPENLEEKYKSLLAGYKYYNVRETSGVCIIKKLFDIDASLTVDPTLLLRRENWEKVMNLPSGKKLYILVYQISPSSKLIEVVKRLKAETGYEVIAVPFIMGGYFGYKSKFSIGPAEWLGLFYNASYVVTDSFHGTAFSMIFNKKVWCCVPKTESRITSFLDLLGLSNRVIYNDANVPEDLTAAISFDNVNTVLTQIRNKGIDTIRLMLDDRK